ncbi:MAG: fatty acid hydroxylase [Methanosarcinales archaeon]|nr:fatty acid hydroxylase [Methanosarcinales archaeon]
MAHKGKLFESIEDVSPRIFDNPILDFLSRVSWWVVPIIYVPMIAYFSYVAIATPNISILKFVLYFVLGVFIWTFMEYSLHRWAFHFEAKTKQQERILFLVHGIHHDYPQDSKRLVMPPSVSLILAVITYSILYGLTSIFGATYLVPAIFAGVVTGYLYYDMVHYSQHHMQINNPYYKDLKEYHMKHHYKEPDLAFGISNKFWDRIFGTLLD